MLAEAEGALSLGESAPRRHLARSLGPVLGLATERSTQILDAVLLAVALNPLDAAVRRCR